MSVFKSLHNPSYKGIEFLFIDESANSGKKTISHEYPNSDRRYVEELGKIPMKFLISLHIHGDIENRIQFENKLKEPSSGILIHPIYGNVENVVATTYTVSSDLTDVGVFKFRVNFEVSSSKAIAPSTDDVSESVVSNDAGDVRDKILDIVEDKYVPTTSAYNHDQIYDKIDNVFDTIKDSINKIVNPTQQYLSEFNKEINETLGDINTVMQSGTNLKGAFESVINTVLNVVDTPDKLEDFWNELIDFNLTSSGIPASSELSKSTTKRKELADNSTIIDEVVRLTALASLHESIAYKESNTTDEINNEREYIVSKYNQNINDIHESFDEDDVLLINDLDLRNLFTTLRNNTNKILNEKLSNAWKITTITPGVTSMLLTSYRYYGNIDNMETLSNLNKNLNVATMRNHIDVLSV